MKLGFTGTQKGMSEEQIKALTQVMIHAVEVTEAHHGMCIGADAQFHYIIRRVDPARNIKIVGHPASNFVSHKRAEDLDCDELRNAKPSLHRNQDIVDEVDFLIATPKSEFENLRSGTWATIRHARKQKKDYVIIYPNGNLDVQVKPALMTFVCGPSEPPKCICKCPDGPCEHVWDGPVVEPDELSSTVTCSRCGITAMNHDLWTMP